MEWGSSLHNPKVQAKTPNVPTYCLPYLKAFVILSDDRLNIGGQVGGIPMPSKKAYLDLYPEFDTDTFLSVIGGVDHQWIAANQRVQAMRAKKDSKK
jgi:hypothetical protein